MVDIHSPRGSLAVHLPVELIEELRVLAHEKDLSIDDVVMEACLAYTEPYTWERCYKEWRHAHPDEPRSEFGIDGNDIAPSANEGRS
ncbi:MAG TPA: hypothetical protein DDY78_07840 [Planctomycetales bacterium]|jgi:hypothetical protein|nr:hypothetical protein [Planctomycetales bacterium]